MGVAHYHFVMSFRIHWKVLQRQLFARQKPDDEVQTILSVCTRPHFHQRTESRLG